MATHHAGNHAGMAPDFGLKVHTSRDHRCSVLLFAVVDGAAARGGNQKDTEWVPAHSPHKGLGGHSTVGFLTAPDFLKRFCVPKGDSFVLAMRSQNLAHGIPGQAHHIRIMGSADCLYNLCDLGYVRIAWSRYESHTTRTLLLRAPDADVVV